MPRPWPPGPPGQGLPREPYPSPGVVEANAELIQAQVLVPLFAQERVMVVRVRPVALGRKDLAVGIIPVVVGGLALMFGQARHAPTTIQVIPVGLALGLLQVNSPMVLTFETALWRKSSKGSQRICEPKNNPKSNIKNLQMLLR